MDTSKECRFAPRHRPNYQGICQHCLTQVPAPWYMRRRADPGDLVGEIAAKLGHPIPQYVAGKIAEGLLDWADRAYEVRELVVREAWQSPGYRERVRKHLRWKLLDEIASQGMIPTALPSEALRYLEHPVLVSAASPAEVPPDAVKAGAPYAMVEVTLAVQCRTPAVDRAAAVKAGVL